MLEQEKIVDKLLDLVPGEGNSGKVQDVFMELYNYNRTASIKLSVYKLAELWNSSDAVKYKVVRGKTAFDFYSEEDL